MLLILSDLEGWEQGDSSIISKHKICNRWNSKSSRQSLSLRLSVSEFVYCEVEDDECSTEFVRFSSKSQNPLLSW